MARYDRDKTKATVSESTVGNGTKKAGGKKTIRQSVRVHQGADNERGERPGSAAGERAENKNKTQ